MLAASLLARVAPTQKLSLSATALALLQGQDYPDNVRELRNMLERAALQQRVSAHQGSRAELTAKLGVSERSLYRKLKYAESTDSEAT